MEINAERYRKLSTLPITELLTSNNKLSTRKSSTPSITESLTSISKLSTPLRTSSITKYPRKNKSPTTTLFNN